MTTTTFKWHRDCDGQYSTMNTYIVRRYRCGRRDEATRWSLTYRSLANVDTQIPDPHGDPAGGWVTKTEAQRQARLHWNALVDSVLGL